MNMRTRLLLWTGRNNADDEGDADDVDRYDDNADDEDAFGRS